jgi:L-fuconolactonase
MMANSAPVGDRAAQAARGIARHVQGGGMGQPYFGFGFELHDTLPTYLELVSAWRPWTETVIETFGVERCMMESNFPADRRSCDFVTLRNALKHIVTSASRSDKNALFHDNAARVYRIRT